MEKLMSQKVLLINPPVFKVDEPWYDTPNFVRTGLAYLAGYLRQYPGFDIRIIDAKFERIDFKKTLKRIIEFKPQILGLCAFTNEIKPAAYLAKLVKEKLPETKIVIGGVHVTALPDKTLEEFPSFDIGVIGEGEVTFYELCSAIKNEKPIENTFKKLCLTFNHNRKFNNGISNQGFKPNKRQTPVICTPNPNKVLEIYFFQNRLIL